MEEIISPEILKTMKLMDKKKPKKKLGFFERDKILRKKFSQYKYRAKKKGILFDLPFPAFMYVTAHNCHYCDVPVNEEPMGIDRMDNNKGYTQDNVAPCCWTCNRSKSIMDADEYIEHCKKVAKLFSGNK